MKNDIHITEGTMIPLSWAVSSLVFLGGVMVPIAFWIFNVDARLARIEEKLDIKVAQASFIPAAEAHEKRCDLKNTAYTNDKDLNTSHRKGK